MTQQIECTPPSCEENSKKTIKAKVSPVLKSAYVKMSGHLHVIPDPEHIVEQKTLKSHDHEEIGEVRLIRLACME